MLALAELKLLQGVDGGDHFPRECHEAACGLWDLKATSW